MVFRACNIIREMSYTACVLIEGKRFADDSKPIGSSNDGKCYAPTRNVGRVSAPQGVPDISYVNMKFFHKHDTHQLCGSYPSGGDADPYILGIRGPLLPIGTPHVAGTWLQCAKHFEKPRTRFTFARSTWNIEGARIRQ